MARKRKMPDGLWERNGTYYARFRGNGRLIRKRLSRDFDVACELLRDLRARADKADFNLVDNDYAWADLKKEFLRWVNQTKRRPQEYEADLERFEAYCPLRSVRQIDQQYVVGFRAWRLAQGIRGKIGARTVTPRTINKEVGTLQNMLNRGVDWKRIGSNPIAELKPLRHDKLAKERRPLSVDEVQRIFTASSPHLLPVWRMYMCTGIRRNELVELRWDDIDFEARSIIIRAEWSKNHKAREIPLDDEVYQILVELQAQAEQRCPIEGTTPAQTQRQAATFSRDHVFVTKANTPLRNNLLSRFYAVCKKAGIEGAEPGGSVDIHSMRLTFTTLSIDGGANPKSVQEMLGHSTLALTMNVYNKASSQSKRAAIAALPFARVTAPAHVIPTRGVRAVCTSSKSNPHNAATHSTQVA